MAEYPWVAPALLRPGRYITGTPNADRHIIGCQATGRSRRMIYLLAAVWILNAFDLSLTVRAQADGILHEGNPLARAVLAHGAAAIGTFKLALVGGASYLLYHFRRRLCAEVATTVVLVAYVGVALQWKLCYEMYDISHTGGVEPADFARIDAVTQYLPVF